MKSKVKILVDNLRKQELTIALAESVTCGLATHQLNVVKGTSEILMGSVICYNEAVKSTLLSVRPSLIKKHSAESPEVTGALAKNLIKVFNASLYAAITGLASPGASQSKEKPVGTIFFAILFRKKIFQEKKKFTGSPLQIKKKSVEYLYGFINRVIKQSSNK